jgi:X-X-X-Leu-X-X-Gly heptad repeat protein
MPPDDPDALWKKAKPSSSGEDLDALWEKAKPSPKAAPPQEESTAEKYVSGPIRAFGAAMHANAPPYDVEGEAQARAKSGLPAAPDLENYEREHNDAVARAIQNHPVANAAGKMASTALLTGLVPGGGTVLGQGLIQGAQSGSEAAGQGEPVAPAALKGTALGLGAAGAGKLLASGVRGFTSDSVQQFKDKALELAAQGLSPKEAIAQAQEWLSSQANAALKQGAGKVAMGGLGSMVGNAVGGHLGALMGGAHELAAGAKQLASGLLQRPGVITQLAKVDQWGPAIASAAASGANSLLSTLFAIGQKDPGALKRVENHLLAQRNETTSPTTQDGTAQ